MSLLPLCHLLRPFVGSGDYFGMGEGAGVDADFIVGRGDEAAEDERRGLLQRKLGFQCSIDGVVTIELEQHPLPVFLRRKSVKTGLAGKKVSILGIAILLLAKTSESGKPFLVRRPPPENTIVLAFRRRRKLEDEIIAS